MGAKTSARSTIPSSIAIGWCHVIFMPSRISVRAVTSGNSLMRFSSSKNTSYHGRGTSAMTLPPHAVHTYHEDEEEPTLSLRRALVLAAPFILVAVAAYFSIHDCAVGGAMGPVSGLSVPRLRVAGLRPHRGRWPPAHGMSRLRR